MAVVAHRPVVMKAIAFLLTLMACTPAAAQKRNAIVPLVDHHQHLVGPAAVIRHAAPQRVDLPTELAPLVAARKDLVPTAFGVEGSVGWIAGTVPMKENVFLGLKKEGDGWKVATEQVNPIPAQTFDRPLDADRLIRDLNDAGIERAVVLSVAYWFGSPNRRWEGDEYTNVRKENDWTAAEAARYPGRLIPFCGVSPIKDYAVAEVQRCAKDLRMKGLKMHFRSSGVDVFKPEHVEKVRKVFRAANDLGMAIVVHSRGGTKYGRDDVRAFIENILPAAPDVPVQIAHLWGGNEYVPEALAAFAEAVSSNDPRTKNLLFDLTEIEPHSDATLAKIAERIRQIGLKRIFYGSDAPTTAEGIGPAVRWGRLRHRLPLTDDELKVIANNVAPYLF